jgi:hypothetical protein
MWEEHPFEFNICTVTSLFYNFWFKHEINYFFHSDVPASKVNYFSSLLILLIWMISQTLFAASSPWFCTTIFYFAYILKWFMLALVVCMYSFTRLIHCADQPIIGLLHHIQKYYWKSSYYLILSGLLELVQNFLETAGRCMAIGLGSAWGLHAIQAIL